MYLFNMFIDEIYINVQEQHKQREDQSPSVSYNKMANYITNITMVILTLMNFHLGVFFMYL